MRYRLGLHSVSGLIAALVAVVLHGALQAAPLDSARLVQDARTQIGVTTGYDPAYRVLAFPMGDVDARTGVCTDVVVRVYRRQGFLGRCACA